MNPFSTHIPILLACLRKTEGPILELGSGWFSTPVLSAFATGRFVRTVEANPEWYSRIMQIAGYQPITNHRHQVLFAPNYDDAPIDDHDWGIVLLDHEPPARRGVDAERLRGKCRLMIGHDSEHPAYGYDEVFGRFRYRYTYSRAVPWTTVVSDIDPLDWLDEALLPLW